METIGNRYNKLSVTKTAKDNFDSDERSALYCKL